MKNPVLIVLVLAGLVVACDSRSPLPTSAAAVSGDRAGTASATASGLSGPDASAASHGTTRLVEIEGRVASVSPPSLVVASRRSSHTVRTSIATRIEKDDKRISLSDIKAGDRVEVEGVVLSDGSILAREIEVEGEDEDDGEVEFTGTIESISGNVLVVSGRTVHVSPFTVIKRDGQRIGLEQLKVGDRVEIEGVRLADGTIMALEIEVREPDDEDDDDDEDDRDDEDDDDDDEGDDDEDDGDD